MGLDKYATKTQLFKLADDMMTKAPLETVKNHDAKLRSQAEFLTVMSSDVASSKSEIHKLNDTIIMMCE